MINVFEDCLPLRGKRNIFTGDNESSPRCGTVHDIQPNGLVFAAPPVSETKTAKSLYSAKFASFDVLELERVSFIIVSKKYSPAMELRGKEIAISITRVNTIFSRAFLPQFSRILEARTSFRMA